VRNRALVLDSGALIGFERGKLSVGAVLKAALLEKRELVVPAVVVAEVWRGGPRSARIARMLQGCRIEPLFDEHARRAGEALRHVRGTTIDAIVVATAARYGTPLVTTDPDDLEALADHFGGLEIIPV
jgi:predicted nucleic acid-binding protein